MFKSKTVLDICNTAAKELEQVALQMSLKIEREEEKIASYKSKIDICKSTVAKATEEKTKAVDTIDRLKELFGVSDD